MYLIQDVSILDPILILFATCRRTLLDYTLRTCDRSRLKISSTRHGDIVHFPDLVGKYKHELFSETAGKARGIDESYPKKLLSK